jgi:hypothetical protein
MSIDPINRRDFLTAALAIALAPGRLLAAELAPRQGPYSVDIGILYRMFTFHLEGSLQEQIDRVAGRYEVRSVGQGDGIASRMESVGVLRDGRWTPVRGTSWGQIRGRESQGQITYDHERRRIEYHGRSETFFLRRLRVVDDVLAMPEGLHVDDAFSALLNYREGRWTPDAGGRLRTHVVRRRRADDEGPDDVAGAYRAEIVPLDLTVEADPESHKPAILLDLSRFSSWARANRPARVVFDEDRRLALITGSLILGTTIAIRVA